MEPLPAVLAGVRPRVGVDEQVRRQRGRPLKTLTAYLAVETSFLKREQSQSQSVSYGCQVSTATVTVRCEYQDVWGLPESARLCVAPG